MEDVFYTPLEVIKDGSISIYARLIYVFYYELGKNADVGLVECSHQIGLSVSCVNENIKELLEAGYMSRRKNSDGSYSYHLQDKGIIDVELYADARVNSCNDFSSAFIAYEKCFGCPSVFGIETIKALVEDYGVHSFIRCVEKAKSCGVSGPGVIRYIEKTLKKNVSEQDAYKSAQKSQKEFYKRLGISI